MGGVGSGIGELKLNTPSHSQVVYLIFSTILNWSPHQQDDDTLQEELGKVQTIVIRCVFEQAERGGWRTTGFGNWHKPSDARRRSVTADGANFFSRRSLYVAEDAERRELYYARDENLISPVEWTFERVELHQHLIARSGARMQFLKLINQHILFRSKTCIFRNQNISAAAAFFTC